ncbi:MAG: UDP-glucose 4-epimerase GalE [Candidatus Sumerlaeaceae bacterium]|nr:UDP-glucose 4-epimerase GalE [Candidatus Sumerlaeaceae bacterium]
MKVLVLGGAGYIGSVCTEYLLEAGHSVAVVDNLSRGHRDSIPANAIFFQGDIGDDSFMHQVFDSFRADAVMHFCALSLVGESVVNPALYYQNNVAAGISLLQSMLAHDVRKIIFSSTAAVYGEPSQIPIVEEAPKIPVNPYGKSKLMFEEILADMAAAHGLRAVSLRYFNAAGATTQHGEDHCPETHLIPLVLDAALGRREYVLVFGTDYPTPDGSCIRDFIHVADLARAHLLALDLLEKVNGAEAFNLGNGQGFSVLQIIEAAREVTGRSIPVKISHRRPGDPAVLVASARKAQSVLGWQPEFTDIREIIASAWRWKLQHPNGYAN